MSKLHILHLEDNPVDAELCAETLAGSGIDCDILRVDSRNDFAAALGNRKFDLIISDFSLPGFDGKSALAFAHKNYPETPFIFVSGTIGEDAAIDSLVNGATDYVLKHKFSRLMPAVQRALAEAKEKESRRQAEEAIRQSEEKYRRIFEESKDAIFIRTPEGHFVDINPAGIEMLGYSDKPEVLALDGRDGFYQEAAWSKLRALIAERGYVRDHELTIRQKGGANIIVMETVTAVRNEEGAVVAHDGIWRDVTEQRKLEAQFLRMQRLENIGKLSSGVAHDMNNILAPILMGVELIRERTSDPKIAPILDTIQKSGQRGADLIRQILAFARGITSQRSLIQLRHLIRDVEKVMRETMSKAIEVSSDAPTNLWMVIADSTQMHQVLMNLCINARDAMPDGGTLTIAARNVRLAAPLKRWGLQIEAGPYVALEVTDTGHGIPPDTLDKIFEPFFTTKEIGKGTGLGLSTVQAIVKGHSGLVDVTSTENRGTVITAYIPAELSQRESAPVERQNIISGNGELILVVDDESAIRDIARATLEAFGYTVLTASDGAEGLALFVQHRKDLKVVMTDMNMPVLGGKGFVEAIERIDQTVRVICASGSSPGVGGNRPSESKIVRGYLEKPFTAEELLQRISAVLQTD